MNKREYVLFAGINGAGKSTLYEIYKKDYPVLEVALSRINPDEILRENGGNPELKNDQAKSAREALQRIKQNIEDGISFNQETTLAGNVTTHIKRLKKLKESGYTLTLYYVSLNSVELAISRINNRVKKGGHNIPEELVRKRYVQTFENLKEVLPYFENVDVFENSKQSFLRIFKSQKNKILLNELNDYPYLKFIEIYLKNKKDSARSAF